MSNLSAPSGVAGTIDGAAGYRIPHPGLLVGIGAALLACSFILFQLLVSDLLAVVSCGSWGAGCGVRYPHGELAYDLVASIWVLSAPSGLVLLGVGLVGWWRKFRGTHASRSRKRSPSQGALPASGRVGKNLGIAHAEL